MKKDKKTPLTSEEREELIKKIREKSAIYANDDLDSFPDHILIEIRQTLFLNIRDRK